MKLIFFISFILTFNFSRENMPAIPEYNQIADTGHLKKIIRQIAGTNVFEMPGNPEGSSSQIERAEQMNRETSTFDLVKICMENKNPVVRLYAFMNLAKRMDNLPAEVVLKFKNDRTLISFKNRRGDMEKLPLNQIANGFLN